MPVTKTAKRALRSSKRKEGVNSLIRANLEAAVRIAKKKKASGDILKAISLADRAVKKNVIRKNKASRIKSTLAKLLPSKKSASKPKKSPTK